MKNRKRTVLVVLVGLLGLRLLLMATMPLFEPSEARYGAIAANMARSGDYLVPSFTYNGVYQPYKGKPPLVFQCGGLSCQVFGVCEFAVRLVPFAAFLALLTIVFFCMRRVAGAPSAILAVGICATITALYGTSGVFMTDVPLSLCTAGSLFMYACFREREQGWLAAGIGLLLGCGMLVKGPVALVLFALPVLVDAAVNRNWRLLVSAKWIWAVPVFFVVATPWFMLMHRRDPDFLRYFFLNENLLRFVVHDYGDRYGAGRETFRGMAILWAFVTTLPWSIVPLVRIAKGKVHTDGMRNFFFLAFVVTTAFWCLTSRVPFAYLLPASPLFAAMLATARRGRKVLWRMLPFAAVVTAIVSAGILFSGLFLTDKMLGEDAPKRIGKRYFAYEFYHGPWGEGAPK